MVLPPIVNVLLFNDCIVAVDAFSDNPFLFPPFVNADMDAIGVVESTPVNAKSADVVAVPPNNRSAVVLNGASAPLLICQ